MGEIVQPAFLSPGDIIELLLHIRGKVDINQIGEVLLHQPGDGKRREGRDQFFSLHEDIAAFDDGIDDGSVSAGAPDSFIFKNFNQSCLGIAGGRLCLMFPALEFPAIDFFIY